MSWRPNRTATYWPLSYGHNIASFPFSWDAQPGAWWPSLSGTWSSFHHLLSLTPTARSGVLRAPSAGCWFSLQHLISNCQTFCLHSGYIIVRRPLSSCGHHKSHLIQSVHGQGYILIFLNRMHLLFTQVHFLFWQLGRVWGQYTTERSSVQWLEILGI